MDFANIHLFIHTEYRFSFHILCFLLKDWCLKKMLFKKEQKPVTLFRKLQAQIPVIILLYWKKISLR